MKRLSERRIKQLLANDGHALEGADFTAYEFELALCEIQTLHDAMLGITSEVDGLADLLADSGELRVRETPAVERLNEIVESLGKLLPTPPAETKGRAR